MSSADRKRAAKARKTAKKAKPVLGRRSFNSFVAPEVNRARSGWSDQQADSQARHDAMVGARCLYWCIVFTFLCDNHHDRELSKTNQPNKGFILYCGTVNRLY
jgi:hypothetical protein